MEPREPLEITIISEVDIVITTICPGSVSLKEFSSKDPFNSETGNACVKKAMKTQCNTITHNNPKCFVAIHNQKFGSEKQEAQNSNLSEQDIEAVIENAVTVTTQLGDLIKGGNSGQTIDNEKIDCKPNRGLKTSNKECDSDNDDSIELPTVNRNNKSLEEGEKQALKVETCLVGKEVGVNREATGDIPSPLSATDERTDENNDTGAVMNTSVAGKRRGRKKGTKKDIHVGTGNTGLDDMKATQSPDMTEGNGSVVEAATPVVGRRSERKRKIKVEKDFETYELKTVSSRQTVKAITETSTPVVGKTRGRKKKVIEAENHKLDIKQEASNEVTKETAQKSCASSDTDNKDSASPQPSDKIDGNAATVKRVGRPPKRKLSVSDQENLDEKDESSGSLQVSETLCESSPVTRSGRPVKRKWSVGELKDLVDEEEIKQEMEDYKEFPCQVCDKVFLKQASLNSHMNAHKDTQEKDCKVCGKVFKKSKYLKVHCRRHEGCRDFKCSHCDKMFLSKAEASAHELLHTEEKPYVCTECGAAYRSKFSLKQHMVKHTKVELPSSKKEYQCHLCDKVFYGRKAYLTVHLKRHAGEKKFKCSYCDVRHVTKSEKLAHEARHTGEKNHSCEICGRAFLYKYALVLHMKIHTGEKIYTCEICGRGFMKKTSYVGHVKFHNNQKDFVCEICGKAFQIRNSLSIHMKKHDENANYNFPCNVCGRKFSMVTKLNRHLMTHSGEKPFVCEVCGFQTADKSSLVAHKRRHTGEKPFPCRLCGKPFRAVRQRNTHEKIHEKTIDRRRRDPNEVYQCEVCEKIFERRAQLTRHRKRHDKHRPGDALKPLRKVIYRPTQSQECIVEIKDENSSLEQQNEAVRNLLMLEGQADGDVQTVTVLEAEADDDVHSVTVLEGQPEGDIQTVTVLEGQPEGDIHSVTVLEAQPEDDVHSVTVIEEAVDNIVNSPIIIYYQNV